MDTAIVMAFTGLYGASTLAVFVQTPPLPPKKKQQQQKTNNKAHSSWSVLTGNCTVRQNSCQTTSFNKRKQKKTLQGQEIQFDDSKLLVLACGRWSKCTHPSL